MLHCLVISEKIAMVQSMGKNTDKEVIAATGIPYFAIGEYREAARNYGGKKIVRSDGGISMIAI